MLKDSTTNYSLLSLWLASEGRKGVKVPQEHEPPKLEYSEGISRMSHPFSPGQGTLQHDTTLPFIGALCSLGSLYAPPTGSAAYGDGK